MKKIICIVMLCIALVGCGNINKSVGTKIVIGEDMNVETIASLIKPAIVGIDGISDSGDSVGSGVCVASGGYILTNSHVVNGCDEIKLILSDSSITTAEIIYEDTVGDLAILRSAKSLPYLSLGDSDDLQVGEDILAVGTPLSLTLVHTFTKGIISAMDRTLKVGSTNGEGFMQNLIQHDASLNPGNSGGPLINSKGEVVGINTLKINGGEGIGFAIPSKSFKSLLASYVNKINYKIPYLGLFGLDSSIAKFNGKTDEEDGFFILGVAENSPLKLLGLENNCVIKSVNNRKIVNTLDLKDELYKLSKGDIIQIEYKKDNNLQKIQTIIK